MSLPRLAYGLARAVPPGATSAWGCRAIITQDGSVDLVPDRTDRQGPATILDLLDAEFPPATLIATLARLLCTGQMNTRSSQRFTLYETPALTVVADTCASAGYCYLAAWTTTKTTGHPQAPRHMHPARTDEQPRASLHKQQPSGRGTMTPPGRRSRVYDGLTYTPGTRFRVVREGATLCGMVPQQGGYRGWRQQLQVGDVLTCTGYSAGFGADPGYGVEFTTAGSEAARACHCTVRPQAGTAFSYRPAPGLLEPADADGRAVHTLESA